MGNGIPLAPIAIAGATVGFPLTLTTAVPHGVVDVTWVTVAGVGGTTTANGSWIAARLDPTHLWLRDAVGNAAYTGGGTVTPTDTFAVVAELTNLQDVGLMATVLDVTSHDGGLYASRIPSFLSGNAMRLDINLVPLHPTHNWTAGLMAMLLARVKRNWLVVWPDAGKTAWHFTGFVVADRSQAPVAGALTASITIEIDGAPSLAAA
jgi:hypothetical protein